ncbi:MAG: PilZ domain-containing protein [Deltaproteobacteria bacterium]
MPTGKQRNNVAHMDLSLPRWTNKEETMVDLINRRELLRLSVKWLLAVRTESGFAEGETRNITGEGFFLYCSTRLHQGTTYAVTIKLPEKRVQMTGKVTWSNLDNCGSLNFGPAMGFYFMRIDADKDKQVLREAMVEELNKPPRLRQQADQQADSLPSSQAKATARPDGAPQNPRALRN